MRQARVEGRQEPRASLPRALDLDVIEAELDARRGFPIAAYSDPEVFAFDMAAVFENRWLFLAPSASVRNPGDVICRRVGANPVIVARGLDGQLRAMSNICRHRGFAVVGRDLSGSHQLVCPYHAWVYGLDGRLLRAPDTRTEPGFDPADHGLRPLSVDVWGPAVFVNTDPHAPSLASAMPELLDLAREQGFVEDIDRYEFVARYEKSMNANWKLWTDNGVECYHCAPVHGESFGKTFAVQVADGRQSIRQQGTVMYSPFKPRHVPGAELQATYYRTLLLFPGAHLLQLDDLMVLGRMTPTGPTSCDYTASYFAEKGADPRRVAAWIALFNRTFDEDAEVVETQQRNLSSPHASPFRFIGNREQTAISTNRLILAAYRDLAQARARTPDAMASGPPCLER